MPELLLRHKPNHERVLQRALASTEARGLANALPGSPQRG